LVGNKDCADQREDLYLLHGRDRYTRHEVTSR
jgi:hypothetical protein